MPYIKQEERRRLAAWLVADSPGELNYVLTRSVLAYLELHGLSYHTINDIVGALEQAKDEFQRRIVHPYEDVKKEENGDVYPSRIYAIEGEAE
jgi:hypothetical protein